MGILSVAQYDLESISCVVHLTPCASSGMLFQSFFTLRFFQCSPPKRYVSSGTKDVAKTYVRQEEKG